MVQNLAGSHVHFSGDGYEEVTFTRPIHHLYLTTSGDVSISFDGGVNFMPLANTTHVFPRPHTRRLFFNGGAWDGVGIAT